MEDDDLGSKPGSRLGSEVKTKKKKRDSASVDNDGQHRVTFTVTIAQAVPTGDHSLNWLFDSSLILF